MSMLEASSNLSKEYCATVVKLGEIKAVEGSDFLGLTLVEGYPIVVRKDQVHEGEFMIYVQNESALNLDFLSSNNSFDWDNRESNANYQTVIKPLLDAGNKDEAKKNCGFINKYGRIKIIKLRGQVSMGILFPKEALVAWKPELKDLELGDYLGQDFDTVKGDLFVKAYVPPIKERSFSSRQPGRNLTGNRFDRLVEGQFSFHYNTQNLQRNINRLTPKDSVSISVKYHGTSAIFANILVRKPVLRTWFEKRIYKWALKTKNKKLIENTKPKVKQEFGNVYSSRSVIKNRYVSTTAKSCKDDIWGEYNNLLKNYIPQGYTIYGEICGYLSGVQKMIQKDYDYGCEPGTNFFMPYRITQNLSDGKKKEFSIKEVVAWTKLLLQNHPELKDRIRELNVLYVGKLANRYPDAEVNENWSQNVLTKLEQDLDFGMEGLEPVCTFHKVPREGFCMRINDDPIPECFKCKCKAFLFRESKEIDAGNVDIEMVQGYGE